MQTRNRKNEFSFSFGGGTGTASRVAISSTDGADTLTAADSATLVLQQDVRKAIREVYDLVVTA